MPGQEAKGDDFGKSFLSSIMVCCVYSLELSQ